MHAQLNIFLFYTASDGMNVTAMGWKIGRYAFFLVIMFMLCN